MNAQQIEFTRLHGITYCPPVLELSMNWYRKFDWRASEAEFIRSWASLDLDATPSGQANLKKLRNRKRRNKI